MSALPSERKIGSTSVPGVGFGAMSLGTPWYGRPVSEEEKFKVLDTAYEKGCVHWDTADVYGQSETIIGEWFKRTGKRDEIFLATKFGCMPPEVRGDPEYVKEAFADSLRKLGVESVDLLYLHRIDAKTPIELTVRAMAELVKAGKVKHLGLSECSAVALRRAHAVHPISALQIEYSPFCLDHEKNGLIDAAKELGVTVVAFSPLGKGILTGAYKSQADFEDDDFRKNLPKYSDENFPKITALVSRIKSIGDAHGATPGQTAMAWLLAQGEHVVVIPGTSKVKYLEENIGTANVHLTADEIAELRRVAEASDIVGARYSVQAHLDRIGLDSPALEE